MIRIVGIALGIAFVCAGCDGSGPQGVLAAPHGGLLVSIPENKGYVEVVKRPVAGQDGPGQVVIYLLDPSRNALSPAPTAVSLKLRGVRNPKPIELKAASDGALETPVLKDQAEVDGDLQFTLDGKPVTVPINVR